MKKIYVQRVIKGTVLAISIAFMVLFLQHLMILNDHNTDRIRGYYKEENDSLDVVFLGASEIYSGFAPGYAYEKYGFTSYMYSISANPGSLYKAELKEILASQSPQLIFVEINGFLYNDDQRLTNDAQLHLFVDNIPRSDNKDMAIEEFPGSNKEEFLLPFFKYRGNWEKPQSLYKQLRKGLKSTNTPSVIKGLHTYTDICPGLPVYYDHITPADYSMTAMAEGYLVAFLEYCQESGLDNVVFINFPRILGGEKGDAFLSRVDHVAQVVADYGYPFLNLHEKAHEAQIVFPADFYNTHHLNIYGQQKMTCYLGDLIVNTYHLTPRPQSDENKSNWETSAIYTREYFAYADQCYRDDREIWISEDSFLDHLNTQR